MVMTKECRPSHATARQARRPTPESSHAWGVAAAALTRDMMTQHQDAADPNNPIHHPTDAGPFNVRIRHPPCAQPLPPAPAANFDADGHHGAMASLSRRLLLFPRLARLWFEMSRADRLSKKHTTVPGTVGSPVCPACGEAAPCPARVRLDSDFARLHDAFVDLARRAMS